MKNLKRGMPMSSRRDFIRWFVALCVAANPMVQDAEAALPGVGVVVESVAKDSAGDRAGLQPGDVLLSWLRPANPADARSELKTPFDWMDLETEQGPRGEVKLFGVRGGTEFSVTMAPANWGLAVRPQMSEGLLSQYHEAKKLIQAKAFENAIALWREAAAAAQRERPELACWLRLKLGDALAEARKWDEAHGAYRDALETARQGPKALPGSAPARVWKAEGEAFEKEGEPVKAEAAYREALRLWTRLSLESLGMATIVTSLGALARNRGDLAAAEEFHRQALTMREGLAPGSLDVAGSLNNLGNAARARGDFAAAETLHRRALAIRERLDPAGLDVASSLNNLGIVAEYRGELATAETLYREALAILERVASESLAVARTLNNLGNTAYARGDLAGAEAFHQQALSIRERLAPGSLDVASSLGNLGNVAAERGDLAGAEELYRRNLAIAEALAPGSLEVAASYNNLGAVARERGDLPAAEEFQRRALAIRERIAPGSLDVAYSLNNLGNVAEARGDLAAAADFYGQSLAIKERLAPGNLDVAMDLHNLGQVAGAQGDLARAENLYGRSLAIKEKLAPGSLGVAMGLQNFGKIAKARGDLVLAQQSLRRALTIQEELAPESLALAESLYDLGGVAKARGDRIDALAYFHRAIDALEAQKAKLGGSEEARSSFAAKYGYFYRDYIELLLQQDRPDAALHVLERSRARSLLSMLAERDLVFASEIPDDLARERTITDGEYDRTQASLGELHPEKDAQAIEGLLARLRELREKQGEIAGRIKKVSPRLASLQYPDPLDLPAIQKALDPGTVLLSYSVGEDKTSLFVVQPSPKPVPTAPDISVFTIPLGVRDLRGKVETLRALLEGRSGSYGALSAHEKSLYDDLVRPAEAFIERSKRVVILPDGPLHILPFAALVREEKQRRRGYLIEWKPIHVVISATVYAELKRGRRDADASAATLVAFGDPKYPPLSRDKSDDSVNQDVRSALRGGFDFAPLPASRQEVEAIAALYPERVKTYLGEEATEERAKGAGKDVRYLHFATHGYINERFPLDSALALTIPEKAGEGKDNGLLQAWEVFERVRIDADLVALSACETGLGKEMGGEGLVGLTRAFQYAGARSVLASLWAVSDESTAGLMKGFYGYLKQGKPKDEALRAAQIDVLRNPDTSHPFHWAAFQLIGDWK